MVDKQKQQSGFALLVSLIVVAAVLSIGLAILDLSIKQVRLASTTKDSEIAFHAANAGMECARFWRRQASVSMEAGDPTEFGCFGDTVSVNAGSVNYSSADGTAYVYTHRMDWATNDRCSVITTLAVFAGFDGPLIVSDMRDLIPGFPDGDTYECSPASNCTVVSVQGYNKPCAQITNFGTIQREVLLEF